MGISINLSIIPEPIAADEWQEIYTQSLALLNGYPGEMMGIQRERINSAQRRVYSRKIEHHLDDPTQRHWHVVGDFKSKERGESFVFYQDLDHYRASDEMVSPDEDIIVELIEDYDYVRSIFSNKTQGHPYHIPLLAVAMLVEDRFPKYAAVRGDIDLHQAKEAQVFASTVLKKEIALPISVDAPRLFKRIQEHYQGPEALLHFSDIFIADNNQLFSALFIMSEQDAFRQWFLGQLRNYESANQWGAIDLSIGWLNSTEDLVTLCELACINDVGPKFDPVTFSSSLASTWISIEPSLRDVMQVFRKPEGAIDSIATLFGSFLLDASGGKGRSIRYYMAEEEVLSILVALFPDHSLKIRESFKTRTEQIRQSLSDCQEPVQELIKRVEDEEPEMGDGRSFMHVESIKNLSPQQTFMLKGMAYTLANIRAQIRSDIPELFSESCEQWKDKIVRISHEQGLTLSEDAWKWIDQEEQRELLLLVLTIVLLNKREQTVWNLRCALLENRELCQAALEMSNDEEMLANMAKELRSQQSLASS